MRHNAIFIKILIISFLFLQMPLSVFGQNSVVPVKKNISQKGVATKKIDPKKTDPKKIKKKKDESFFKKEYKDDDFGAKEAEDPYSWIVFKTILILGSIVGAFYYFFRFVTKKTGFQVLGEDVVQMLSVVPIGQNKYIQIVDVAGKLLILGVSDNSINLITEVTGKDEIDRIRLQSSRSRPVEKSSFQDFISGNVAKLMGTISDIKNQKKSKNFNESFTENGSDIDFDYLKRQKERLKKLNGYDDE